ncbi:MAG: thioredoxin family protein [Chloroflexota bacterium]
MERDSSNKATDENAIRVEIFVAQHCFICEYTYEIIELIERDFPEIDLHVIDMTEPKEPIPEVVFATPTYLLNGRVWFLGNPSPDQVIDQLSELLSNESDSDK